MNEEEKRILVVDIELMDAGFMEDEFGEGKRYRCFSDETRQFTREPVEYYYDSKTTIRDLLSYLCVESGFIKDKPECLEWVGDYFMIIIDDHLREFGNIELPLGNLINLSGYPEKQFYLRWDYSLPGGASVLEEDGIKFIIHTDEYVHLGQPHVHAKYSGEEIKIDIDSLKVTGCFKNRKKEKTAIDAVKSHEEFLMRKWKELVCGLKVSDYYYDEDTDSFNEEIEG